MSSIQERLQLKRVPLDKWSVQEQLLLASSVACSGDQNWMSVSRSLKMPCGGNRPSDWFSQKSCAAQYGKLLEQVETPKRKKRTEKDTAPQPVETPGESILRRLTQERMAELNKLIQEEEKEYTQIKNEILAIQSSEMNETKLRETWAQIELEKKQQEKEQLQHAQWLKEREERKIELERAWRPGTAHLYHQQNSPNHSPSKGPLLNIKVKPEDMDTDDSSSRQGTSPLLTSLLKSPSPAPNPGNTAILHSSPASSRAPTITNLLTGTNISPSNVQSSNSFPASIHPLSTLPTYEQASNNIVQSPSQAAPTLSMLLENKNKEMSQQKLPPLARITSPQAFRVTQPPPLAPQLPQTQQQQPQLIHQPQLTELPPNQFENKNDLFHINDADLDNVEDEAAGSPAIKDEDDQQLMEVFNGLIPDNIDELADILTENNAIILNTELLEEEEESILDNVESFMKEHSNQLEEAQRSGIDNIIETLGAAGQSFDSLDVKSQTNDNLKFGQTTNQTMAAEPTEETKKVALSSSITADLIKDETLDSLPVAKDTKLGTFDDKQIVEIKDDDQSDFSNDIPLSELRMQSASKSATQEQQQQQPIVKDLQSSESLDRLKKVEEPDIFESDSNDDKCLESIKREIQGLSGLKENSDNSNEETEKLNFKGVLGDMAAAAGSVTTTETSTTITSKTTLPQQSPDVVDLLLEKSNSQTESPLIAESDTVPIVNSDTTEVNVDTNATKADEMAVESPLITMDNEIVEIKDDKSDDGKPEPPTVIVIEEADDTTMEKDDAIESVANDSNQIETVNIKDDDEDDDDDIEMTSDVADSNANETTREPVPIERKLSTDDECFEDAKETIEDSLNAEENEAISEPKSVEQTITIIDTDDDSPIEVIKEDKVGKTKRDYSRKKHEMSSDKQSASSEEATSSTPTIADDTKSNIVARLKLKERDRSESPYIDDDGTASNDSNIRSKRRYSSTPINDSFPNSPASSDDREYRAWKKSILMVYNRLQTHKCSSLFLKPISEETVPDYKTIILRPQDLQTIKRNIESGHIRTTAEFKRDIMLMCYNTIFYNAQDAVTQKMASEMLTDALSSIETIMDTWKKENDKLSSSTTATSVKTVRGRKSHRIPPS